MGGLSPWLLLPVLAFSRTEVPHYLTHRSSRLLNSLRKGIHTRLADRGVHVRGGAMSSREKKNEIKKSAEGKNIRRVCVVGDVHDMWDEVDEKVLKKLNPDIVIFVGDIGNENATLVKSIAKIPLPKAVILGNHDAWNSLKLGKPTGKLQSQIADLAVNECDGGYNVLRFGSSTLAVVGARPFSMGGGAEGRAVNYCLADGVYGIKNQDGSIAKVAKDLKGCSEAKECIILISHNGPAGLGTNPYDICGKDFGDGKGGDWGEVDLEKSIECAHSSGVRIPLVCFGHMHANLRYGGRRQMVSRDTHGTVYLNAAEVPRWDFTRISNTRCGHFTMVSIDVENQNVHLVEGLWVTSEGNIVSREQLYVKDKVVKTAQISTKYVEVAKATRAARAARKKAKKERVERQKPGEEKTF
ncbi:hypothetical protein AAMO2058_001375100 [Amorphochlora amoebiformis]|mmetsp:Transcript_17956/g.28584  ORF Transcript_17956/g.28584 Transcript_17956/m.28584 type:complete len:412 (-) Transcript_17956:37-1272(-)